MVLQSRHDEVVKQRLSGGPRNASWLGHDMQSELVSTMAQWVLSTIMAEVKDARYYTVIADETKDVSKHEQLSIVLRYVYEGAIYERFIGYVHAKELNAAALAEYILGVLEGLLRQCYSAMMVCQLRVAVAVV